MRVVTASEALLTSVVEEGDTSGGKRESQGTLELSLIRVGVEEAGVVVVVDEDTEGIYVLEVLVVGLPPASDVSHRLSIHPDVSDSEVHGVVEESGDVVLVGADIGVVAVEAFTHLEDTR